MADHGRVRQDEERLSDESSQSGDGQGQDLTIEAGGVGVTGVGHGPIVDQGSAPEDQRLGGPRAVPRSEERVAATAERSRVGAGCRLRARRETVRGGPHGQVEDEVEVRSRRWGLGVTEATDRRDCPGGSHNYSSSRKVLEG